MSTHANNALHPTGLAQKLADSGLRTTPQRELVYDVLLTKRDHPTADEIFARVKASMPTISLATVYNTLRAFVEAGLINEVVVDGARSYFDTRMDDHPHFYWEDRAELTDAPADQLRISGLPDAPDGMQISRVDVVIRLKRA